MQSTHPARFTIAAASIALASAIVFRMPTARATAPASVPLTSEPARPARAATPVFDRSASAAVLHAQAISLQKSGRGREAAALHRASAALRPANDSSAETCLEIAGTLLTNAGDFAEARAALEAGATHAIDRGDRARAAELTILAGFVAREQGDAAGMRAYARKARHLTAA